MAKRAAFLVLSLAAASAGPAWAADDPACAKFEDPLAYNACLASHGPKANDLATTGRPVQQNHPAAPAQAERSGPAPARAVKSAPARSAGRWRRATWRRGRVHMEFEVK